MSLKVELRKLAMEQDKYANVEALAAALGVSAAEATAAIQKVVASLANPWTEDRIPETMGRIKKRQDDERWRTDPLNLMPWFTDSPWRWLAFDALHALIGALHTLAEWVAPDD